MVCWMSLISWIVVESFVTESSPLDSFCQLSACNLTAVDVQPQQHRLCAESFMALGLKLIEPRKYELTRSGRHFFDLYFSPYEEDCIETRLYFDLYNGTMSVKMLLSCWNTTISVYLNFYMKSLAKDRCIDKESTFAGVAHTCNYHRSEQLRLTVIDNNTLMVEDLSTAVPPRSRMILSNRNSSFDHQKKPCNCRNLHRDQKHFDRCMDYLIKVHSNKAEIQREKERASRDFKIALAIVIASFLGNLIARWWVFWKFPDCEFVTRVVYVASAQSNCSKSRRTSKPDRKARFLEVPHQPKR